MLLQLSQLFWPDIHIIELGCFCNWASFSDLIYILLSWDAFVIGSSFPTWYTYYWAGLLLQLSQLFWPDIHIIELGCFCNWASFSDLIYILLSWDAFVSGSSFPTWYTYYWAGLLLQLSQLFWPDIHIIELRCFCDWVFFPDLIYILLSWVAFAIEPAFLTWYTYYWAEMLLQYSLLSWPDIHIIELGCFCNWVFFPDLIYILLNWVAFAIEPAFLTWYPYDWAEMVLYWVLFWLDIHIIELRRFCNWVCFSDLIYILLSCDALQLCLLF